MSKDYPKNTEIKNHKQKPIWLKKNETILRPCRYFTMVKLNKYVVHTYLHSDGSPHWYVAGTRLEVMVVPPFDVQADSLFLSAADLGLKDRLLKEMRFRNLQWHTYNGREDPRAEFHSAAYLQAKTQVEQFAPIIDAAVKSYYSQVA